MDKSTKIKDAASNINDEIREERNNQINKKREKMKKLVDIARWYHIDGESQATIARRSEFKNASSVARLLKDAARQGVIGFDVDETFTIYGHEHPPLARMIDEYFDLKSASVLSVDVLEPYTQEEDDILHISLSNHAGINIRLEADDHIAVAGGRAVYQATRMIARKHPRVKNIRISPLSGRIWTRDWELSGPYHIQRPLDPDDSAHMLALAFANETGAGFRQISDPLFVSDKNEAKAIMDSNRLFSADGTWYKPEPNQGVILRNPIPNRAIVGIGSIERGSGHRFAELLRNEQHPSGIRSHLIEVAKVLKRTVELIDKKQELHIGIGDVNNRMFPTLPLPSELEPDRKDGFTKYEKAFDEVMENLVPLNERIIAARWEHLQAIPSVEVIAGGPHKVNALWTLLVAGYLDPKRKIITSLTTDAVTAEALRRSFVALKFDDYFKVGWYQKMIEKLFPSARLR